MPKKVLVCQNTTCKQQGASQVLEAIEQLAPAEVEVIASGCLGQCGNGPMLLVLPEQALIETPERKKFWYAGVQPQDVAKIVQRHLEENKPVRAKLYPAVHDKQKSIWIWVVGFCLFLGLCVLMAIALGGQSHYPY